MWSAWAERPARGRELLGWLAVSLGVGALQVPALDRMAAYGVGIIDFEFVGTTAQAARFTSMLGSDGLAAAREQLIIDFAYLVTYAIALSGACVLLAARASRRGSARVARVGSWFARAAVAAAACDAVENVALLGVTHGHVNQPWPAVATTFASVKFGLLALVAGFLLVGLFAIRGDLERRSRWWHHLAEVVYNNVVTYIPSHNLRAGFLRLSGATIGRNCSFMRGTTVFGVELLEVGDDAVVAFRCVLDARGGLTIGSHVIISSDVHFISGHHDINADDFGARFARTVVEPYAWIAVRATILAPSAIGKGAVVAAGSLVRHDVPAMDVVAGIPARSVGTRTGGLAYPTVYRPLFH